MGTRLDWVAASHFDTATPHVHIVLRGVRDDGRKLIIPRRYIAYGLREQAERLVTLELGPMQVREAGVKLARQVTQERLTALDRGLMSAAHPETRLVEIGSTPKQGEAWTRRLDIARLRALSRMGLAQKLSPSSWKLSPDMEPTLRKLGERGDILKAYHKALSGADHLRSDLGDVIYDPAAPQAGALIGRIVKTGVLDDVNDKSYAVIEIVSGQSLYVPMGGADNLAGLKTGYVAELSPSKTKVKPSDQTINKIARANHGIYSAAFHLKKDGNARPQFIEAHIRRLEALRRAGIVTRNKDGSWRVPDDYLDKVKEIDARKLSKQPVQRKILVTKSLDNLTKTIGVTWLDRELVSGSMDMASHGFGGEVKKALERRREFLAQQTILGHSKEDLTQAHLSELERRDLSDAGQAISKTLGKPFKQAPATGKLTGRLVDSTERPSGRYAIIERAKDFTLVPWRDALEKRRGMDISAVISRGQVNWQLGRQRGLDIG